MFFSWAWKKLPVILNHTLPGEFYLEAEFLTSNNEKQATTNYIVLSILLDFPHPIITTNRLGEL